MLSVFLAVLTFLHKLAYNGLASIEMIGVMDNIKPIADSPKPLLERYNEKKG